MLQKHYRISYFFLLLLFYLPQISWAQNELIITHPEWSKNAVIYEVNIRQFTPEGTIKAFEKHLPELKNLGVDILWLMPVNPIGVLNRKGSLGSYYSVKNYKDINPEFGTMVDFKNLVRKIHELGMYVIIDWVANHTSWDNVWVESNPEFFTKDDKGNFIPPVTDWSDVIDLNYENKDLWNYMIDAMNFWVKENNIDGFRCDVAAMVPTEFWIEARKELLKSKKDLFLLAEANENYLHKAFNMTYNWPLKDLMNDVAQGKKNATSIIEYFEKEKAEYNINDYRMTFTSNHDENSWNGTEFERLGGAAETFAVLSGTVKGMPLIYTGQEAGLNKRLSFFEKDTVEWKNHKMRGIYTTLNKIKKNNIALWNGAYGGEMNFIKTGCDDVLAFSRQKDSDFILSVFNLSKKSRTIELNDIAFEGKVNEVFTGEKISIGGTLKLILQPWEYKVYSK